jgi:hypothetical protein
MGKGTRRVEQECPRCFGEGEVEGYIGDGFNNGNPIWVSWAPSNIPDTRNTYVCSISGSSKTTRVKGHDFQDAAKRYVEEHITPSKFGVEGNTHLFVTVCDPRFNQDSEWIVEVKPPWEAVVHWPHLYESVIEPLSQEDK